MGKTNLVRTLARVSGCDSKRVQFVPDLLPADILGMNIYDRSSGQLKRIPRPVFTNLLLPDEINRAVPRTQSALLEAMEERQVTIDGETTPLPAPFAVLATQNPVESESTFRLPAAQMDRFLIRLSMGYPDPQEEREMLFSLGDAIPMDRVEVVTSPEELLQASRRSPVSMFPPPWPTTLSRWFPPPAPIPWCAWAPPPALPGPCSARARAGAPWTAAPSSPLTMCGSWPRACCATGWC